jgi:hypothetical protein
MHVPDLKHEFGINPHILPQVNICGIHKVVEFALRDVIRIPWNKLKFDAFLKELPNVAMVFPFLLPHCPPPCGGITFQVRLGKFHGRMWSNLGGMQIISILASQGSTTFRSWAPSKFPVWPIKILHLWILLFEGRSQFTEIEPIHFEEDFQLFLGE